MGALRGSRLRVPAHKPLVPGRGAGHAPGEGLPAGVRVLLRGDRGSGLFLRGSRGGDLAGGYTTVWAGGWPMTYNFHLGLDLGQSRDYTALSLIEEPLWVDPAFSHRVPLLSEQAGWISPAELTPEQANRALALAYHHGQPPHPTLSVRH